MKLGVGKRMVGEPCWSHEQCKRSDNHSFCAALKCHCATGLHNIDGKCSGNYWEDLGLENWELLMIALISTLFLFALFIGCTYYAVSWFARRHRKTLPTGNPPPAVCFSETSKYIVAGKQKNINMRGPSVKRPSRRVTIKPMTNEIKNEIRKPVHLIRKPVISIRKPSVNEIRQPVNEIRQPVNEIRKPYVRIRPKRDEEARQERREEKRRELEKKYSTKIFTPLDNVIFNPTKFILPLEFSHRRRPPYFECSISFIRDVQMRPGGVVRAARYETSSLSHQNSTFSKSSIPSETGSSEPELEWYQPNIRHLRRPQTNGRAGQDFPATAAKELDIL